MADDDLARAIAGQIGVAGLGIGPGGADLQQDVGGEDLVARGGDLGPFVDVLLVGIAGRLAGAGSRSTTSKPALTSGGTEAGIRATRRSPG